MRVDRDHLVTIIMMMIGWSGCAAGYYMLMFPSLVYFYLIMPCSPRLVAVLAGSVLFECQLRRHQRPESTSWSTGEFGVSSVFGDLAILEYDDPFGPGQGRQPVRDEDDADVLAPDDMV